MSDLLTRVRNGYAARLSVVHAPASKMLAQILDVLQREGYINGYKQENVRKGVNQLKIDLKYYETKPVIDRLVRISKPGRRVYSAIGDLAPVSSGLGISILSTPKGVLSDAEARKQNVGGEVLCQVF